mmetsp:Transcript_14053/g.10124  ORF Transcript_14053/g.10124 Transcript_14053/m.10124 type:complete len:191 (+) Transcript_14053:85-657(+)
MKEMKEEVGKEKEQEEKKMMIQGESAMCIRMQIAKVVVKEQKRAEVKLFDFGDQNEIKESFTANEEKEDPLEEPKIYFNIVHSSKVLPPLNAHKEIADKKNDRDWRIIPMSFSEAKNMRNLENREVIFIDAHVNSCVVEKLKEGERQLKAIFNYFLIRFQHHLRDQFVLHKKSIKLLKKTRYKDFKGSNN